MENIQAEEETRPLAQPQRRVAQAYAEINDGSRWVARRVDDDERILCMNLLGTKDNMSLLSFWLLITLIPLPFY